MEGLGEVVESSVTLPMTDDIADDIMWMEENSTYLGTGHSCPKEELVSAEAAGS